MLISEIIQERQYRVVNGCLSRIGRQRDVRIVDTDVTPSPLLGKARKREIALTSEMVDALLPARDVLNRQPARHRAKSDIALSQM
jgi:hypothetical protein